MGEKGRTLGLSPGRKVVMELLHHARKVPSLPLSRHFDLAELAAARREQAMPPSWPALFMRAYGLVNQKHPELRRAFVPWPWPRLYEHPYSIGILLIEREWQGEGVVLGAKIRDPSAMSLAEIENRTYRFGHAPVDKINYFRKFLRMGRMPRWMLRLFFWQTLHFSGYARARRLGTFVLSSLGSMGVEQIHPLSPLTTYLTYGPIDPQGGVVVKIVYDHNVMDGRTVARCLVDLERTLQTEVLAEMKTVYAQAAAEYQKARTRAA